MLNIPKHAGFHMGACAQPVLWGRLNPVIGAPGSFELQDNQAQRRRKDERIVDSGMCPLLVSAAGSGCAWLPGCQLSPL